MQKGNPKNVKGLKDLLREDLKVGISHRNYSTRGQVAAVRLTTSAEPLLAAQFAKLCLSEAGREILRKHHFVLPE